jgi:hypothetical protein
MAGELTIPESILLLALNDETGERKGNFLEYALAGAALTELLLIGRVAESGEPTKRLEIADGAPVGDPYIDACLETLQEKGSGKKAKSYVEALGGKPALLRILLEQLVNRGVLAIREKKILFIFTKTTYPEANPSAERELKARLEDAMFGAGEIDVRDSVIIALAHHTDILKHNFDREKLREHKARIKDIADGGLLPQSATIEAIKAMQAAVAIAAIMPAVIVTT